MTRHHPVGECTEGGRQHNDLMKDESGTRPIVLLDIHDRESSGKGTCYIDHDNATQFSRIQAQLIDKQEGDNGHEATVEPCHPCQ